MKQFGRQSRLVLGNDAESMTLDNLRITFEISKTLSSTPNPATVSVYNLNASHRHALASKHYDRLSLAVGYDSPRVIYTGDIINVQIKRSDVDFITEMACGDGHRDYVNARVSTTLRAGATDAEILAKVSQSMRKTGTGSIDIPQDAERCWSVMPAMRCTTSRQTITQTGRFRTGNSPCCRETGYWRQ